MFTALDVVGEIPARVPSPFASTPHPLARSAAEHLQQRLPTLTSTHDFASLGGKMFGVLVARSASGRVGYLAAFSGMLAERWVVPGCVAPIFDIEARARILEPAERELDQLSREIAKLQNGRRLSVLARLLQRAERQTQRQLASMVHRNGLRKLARRQRRLQIETDNVLAELARQSSADRRELKQLRRSLEARVQRAKSAYDLALEQIEQLRQRRRAISRCAQSQLFNDYLLCAADGGRAPIKQLFIDAQVPGGAGDCAAAKLLHYANCHALQPLCLAEFWWQPEPGPASLRRHRHFYPACNSKCRPLMPFLLSGIDVEPAPQMSLPAFAAIEPRVVYEDDDIVAVSKPAGMLSVPGKIHRDSVEQRLNDRYAAGGSQRMLVHRLDQATSGLLLAAKNRRAHKLLQQQFESRSVSKHYVAVLHGALSVDRGLIELPLRVDLEDRPRQLVCYRHGRQAATRFEVIDTCGDQTRVRFFPFSGRTHQLRVHAAHPDGLDAPIVGDELYGRPGARLLLHAEYLGFRHPSGQMMQLHDAAPF